MAVGRFQVLATLQAARAHELGLPLDFALSWGLNRAISYAAAKRGFKGKKEGMGGRVRKIRQKKPDVYHLGDEMACKEEKNGKLYFTNGGKSADQRELRETSRIEVSGTLQGGMG